MSDQDFDFGDEPEREKGEANDFDDEEFVQLPGVDDLPLFSNPLAQKLDADIKDKTKVIEDISDKIGWY